MFYLPYWFARTCVPVLWFLNNPNDQPASAALQVFSPEGTLLSSYSIQIPALGSTIVPYSSLLAGQESPAPYGMISGTSSLPLSGLVIQSDRDIPAIPIC